MPNRPLIIGLTTFLFVFSPAISQGQVEEESPVINVERSRDFKAARLRNPTCGDVRCKKICIQLPGNIRIITVVGMVKEKYQQKWRVITSSGQAIARAKFVGRHSVFSAKTFTKVCWRFMNWDLKRTRHAKIKVKYASRRLRLK